MNADTNVNFSDQNFQGAPKEDEKFPWADKPIAYMIYWTKHYVVYLDENDEIDLYIKSSHQINNIKEFNRVHNEAAILEGECNVAMGKDKVRQFKRLIGEAIACAIEEDYENADHMMLVASSYIQARSRELSRGWRVLASTAVTGCVILVGSVIWALLHLLKIPLQPSNEAVMAGTIFGSIGALFSVLARSGSGQFASSSGRRLHLLEATSRIIVGTLAGFVATMALVTGLILHPLGAAQNQVGVIILVGLAAGAGERLVNSILATLDSLGLRTEQPGTPTPHPAPPSTPGGDSGTTKEASKVTRNVSGSG